MIIYWTYIVYGEEVEERQDYVPKREYDVTEDWAKEGDLPHQLKPHPCDRVCKEGVSNRCHYVFIVERTSSLGKVFF